MSLGFRRDRITRSECRWNLNPWNDLTTAESVESEERRLAMKPWGPSIFRCHVEEEQWAKWNLSPVGKLEKEGGSRREWSIVSNVAESLSRIKTEKWYCICNMKIIAHFHKHNCGAGRVSRVGVSREPDYMAMCHDGRKWYGSYGYRQFALRNVYQERKCGLGNGSLRMEILEHICNL